MTPYEKRVNELYNDPKNIKLLPSIIFICIICCFINFAIVGIIGVIIAYVIYCSTNNNELNNDEKIIALRKYYKAEYKRLKDKTYDELLNDELYGFYKKYY